MTKRNVKWYEGNLPRRTFQKGRRTERHVSTRATQTETMSRYCTPLRLTKMKLNNAKIYGTHRSIFAIAGGRIGRCDHAGKALLREVRETNSPSPGVRSVKLSHGFTSGHLIGCPLQLWPSGWWAEGTGGGVGTGGKSTDELRSRQQGCILETWCQKQPKSLRSRSPWNNLELSPHLVET